MSARRAEWWVLLVLQLVVLTAGGSSAGSPSMASGVGERRARLGDPVKSDDETSATAVWASHPVAANQTLMLQIYGASTSSKVEVEAWSESTATWDRSTPPLAPESASTSGLAVVLPADSVGAGSTKEYTAYRVTVDGGDPIHVNTPEVWWTLGDYGNSATNGGKGWVRIFGRSIALGGGPSKLKLTHSLGLGKSVVIPMDKTFNHTGRYCAKFPIPDGLAVGEYDIAVSNSLAPSYFAPMSPWFETPERPLRKGQLKVVAPPRSQWPQRVHIVQFEQVTDRPAPTDATPALNRAIAEARSAGGGVVYLPPGTYSITGAIILPANTILKGAGADKTWLTLAKQNMSDAPQTGYFTSNMTGGWGVEDLTIYTSSAGYYYSIFNLQKIHDGVTIRRIVLRAQPFHSQVEFCKSGRANPPEVCNFTWFGGRSPAVLIDGVKNFEITDNDLYSAWISIGNGHFSTNATYGLIARNKLYSGNAAHWFNQVHQVVFEDNHWIGVAMQAYGSNIDTYEGGYSQNLYLSGNSYSFSYGGDREMMTLDTLMAYYFGTVISSTTPESVSPPTVTLNPCNASKEDEDLTHAPRSRSAPPCVMTSSGQHVEGGAIVVHNGTGAGQMRRIVSWPNVSHNPTITIDKAFDPPLDSTSFVTASPYWGHIIWDNVDLSDGGHFQLYGAVFDSVIHGVHTYRLGGIMGLGGGAWYEPNHRIEVSDCYVESHWQSNGFINGGGECGTGNCSIANYWILRNNRGGYGADIGVASENSVEEGNTAYSCCLDLAKSCGVGAKAGVRTTAFVPTGKSAYFKNVVWRNNSNLNVCPPVPVGPV